LSDARGRAILRTSPGIDFFAPVFERTDAVDEPRRYAFYLRDLERNKVDLSCWKDWNPVRDTARQVTSLRAIEAPDPDHTHTGVSTCAGLDVSSSPSP